MWFLELSYSWLVLRTQGGEYNLNDTEVQLKILPSKLRIEYSRVNSHLDRNFGLLPPHSDFPLNWNGYISAVHIDIKVCRSIIQTTTDVVHEKIWLIVFIHPNMLISLDSIRTYNLWQTLCWWISNFLLSSKTSSTNRTKCIDRNTSQGTTT